MAFDLTLKALLEIQVQHNKALYHIMEALDIGYRFGTNIRDEFNEIELQNHLRDLQKSYFDADDIIQILQSTPKTAKTEVEKA